MAMGAASLAACLAFSTSLTLAEAGGGGLGGAIGGAVGGAVGAVGGVVGGTVGAVGGVVGGVTDGVSGALGGATGTGSSASSSDDADAAGTAGSSKKKGLKAKLKLKYGQKTLVKTNFNVGVLNKKSLVNAKAKVGVGNLANAKVGAKALAGDGTLVGAKAKLAVGQNIKAGVGATVGTNGIGANVNVSLGTPGTGGGGKGTTSGDRNAIANQIASLSSSERIKLRKKCGAVLASPESYSGDATLLCRVLAELSVSQAN